MLGGSHVTKEEGQFDIDLKDFLQEKYPKTDLEELRLNIDGVEIKNIIEFTNGKKILRFNLKVYAFIDNAMIDFSQSHFMYDTIATNNFFENLNSLIKVKVHLNNSHITENILGYVHDFCNWNDRENKSEIVMIAHNLFGFDMFVFIKGYHATACNTKD